MTEGYVIMSTYNYMFWYVNLYNIIYVYFVCKVCKFITTFLSHEALLSLRLLIYSAYCASYMSYVPN